MEKIALYRQVKILEKKINSFKANEIAFEHLHIYIELVSEGYFQGFSAAGATNEQMKLILSEMKSCYQKLVLIRSNLPKSPDKEQLEKFNNAMIWLNHASEEIERWSDRGHWK